MKFMRILCAATASCYGWKTSLRWSTQSPVAPPACAGTYELHRTPLLAQEPPGLTTGRQLQGVFSLGLNHHYLHTP